MDVRELEQQLNEALEDYKRKIKDTCDVIESEECKEAIRNLSDDVGHCFADFASTIISTMKKI